MDSYPAGKDRLINPGSLQKLHKPPDTVKWDIIIELGLNSAIGWFSKTDENGHKLIWHGGREFAIKETAKAYQQLYKSSD